jgi:hypothetical protein
VDNYPNRVIRCSFRHVHLRHQSTGIEAKQGKSSPECCDLRTQCRCFRSQETAQGIGTRENLSPDSDLCINSKAGQAHWSICAEREMKESYLIAENKALREINQRLQAEIKTNEWAYVNDYITPLNRIADALEKIAEALQATTKYHEIKEQL